MTAGGEAAGETLAIPSAGGPGAPERLLLVERLAGTRSAVRVREWSSADWSRAAVPRERAVAALLAELREADGARRLLGIEMQRIARWFEHA